MVKFGLLLFQQLVTLDAGYEHGGRLNTLHLSVHLVQDVKA